MYYYHMTSLKNLQSISEIGLTPRSGANSRLIGDNEANVFFSEGFGGAVALFVDFQLVYDRAKAEKTDENIINSKSLSAYLGEGVYLRFDGTNIRNGRNFENGCTDRVIPPEDLEVCILRRRRRRRSDNSVIFSRFEVIRYMMARVNPEQIAYYGAEYEDAPNPKEATERIQGKVREYYIRHRDEIDKYRNNEYEIAFCPLRIFVKDKLNTVQVEDI